ncbi:MAG: SH3 domain-containing protein, partial [Lachnospiraceae bacterium]|nr:SH3 domain-containing protein [Lachnospiraceae bacterium]
MSITRKQKAVLNLLIVALMMTLAIAAASFSSHAISGLEASGYVNCNGGAILRSSASTKSSKIAGLPQGATVEVQKEVFTHKKKRSASYRWYLVNTGAGVGYIRSDLVTITKYGSASGVTKKKVAYRRGAGNKMSKKGNIGKKKTFTIVLEAKAKGSSAVWYKIYRNGGYYYVKRSNTKISNISSGLPQAVA